MELWQVIARLEEIAARERVDGFITKKDRVQREKLQKLKKELEQKEDQKED